jgi:hypothetical protein
MKRILSVFLLCVFASLSVFTGFSETDISENTTAPATTLPFGTTDNLGDLSYISETTDGMYRYEFEDGKGFSSIVKNGDYSAPLGAFKFDDGLSVSVTQNGAEYAYTLGDLITDVGEYAVIVGFSGKYGIFNFAISSDSSGFDISDILPENGVQQIVTTETGYSAEFGYYTFMFPNGALFYGSVPDGAITNYPVKCEFDDKNQTYTLFHNGKQKEYRKGDTLTEDGVYSFAVVQTGTNIIVSDDTLTENSTDDSTTPTKNPAYYTTSYNFYITTEPSNNFDFVLAPRDFYISQVYFNGALIGEYDEATTTYFMGKDGVYEYEFTAYFNSELVVTAIAGVDTTAPMLFFSQNALVGVNTEPVYYVCSEAGMLLTATLNGAAVNVSDGWLSGKGTYLLTIIDGAGNYQTYTIKVNPKFVFTSWTTIIFVVPIVVVFAVVVLLRKYRKPRVL